jgi:predicted ATPase
MKKILRSDAPALGLALVLVIVLALSASAGALAQSSGDLEPDITIREEEDRTIREYRVNGELYAIEIRPFAGPSYYLVDHDGDGDFERREGDRIAVPQWVLKTF